MDLNPKVAKVEEKLSGLGTSAISFWAQVLAMTVFHYKCELLT